MESKRVRYFPGQLLGVQDCVDEQRYLLDRLETAVRLLHGVGVVKGLRVRLTNPTSAQPGGSTLVVSPGFGINGHGRIIAVETSLSVVLPTPQEAAVVSVQIVDVPSDPVGATTPDGTEFSRWEEHIEIIVSSVAPPDAVILALFDGQKLQTARKRQT
jgi:hypothetical protein